MNYPHIIALAPRFVEHLSGCEYGSYEDCQAEKFERTEGSPHIVEILQRHKHGIEVRTPAEVNEVYYALASGTFQLEYTESQGMKGALQEAQRICNYLRPFVTDNDSLLFSPNGY